MFIVIIINIELLLLKKSIENIMSVARGVKQINLFKKLKLNLIIWSSEGSVKVKEA